MRESIDEYVDKTFGSKVPSTEVRTVVLPQTYQLTNTAKDKMVQELGLTQIHTFYRALPHYAE